MLSLFKVQVESISNITTQTEMLRIQVNIHSTSFHDGGYNETCFATEEKRSNTDALHVVKITSTFTARKEKINHTS